jgi:hypothetical protein
VTTENAQRTKMARAVKWLRHAIVAAKLSSVNDRSLRAGSVRAN